MNITYKKNKNIKIISGTLKSKKIITCKTSILRPTKNIIKETVFNWLLSKVNHARCLDCFAGSGSLGIEAISRNASSVTFVESNTLIAKTLKKNINQLNISNGIIFNINIFQWLKKIGHPYDIIFIDPPFKKKLIQKTIILLENNNWLKNNAWIYIEQPKTKKKLVVPNNWLLHKHSSSGNVTYEMYIRKL